MVMMITWLMEMSIKITSKIMTKIEITSRTLSAAWRLIPFDVIPRFLNLVREIIIWLCICMMTKAMAKLKLC